MAKTARTPLNAPSAGPRIAGELAPRRYGRRTAAKRISASLWPDVLACVLRHATTHRLTPSGAVHDLLRRYFKLPTDS
jgi:hypothetical protein